MTRDRKPYDIETKLLIVRRHLQGVSGRVLAKEYDLPSPGTVTKWTRIYRRDDEDGLRPKKRGRPTVNRENPLPERGRATPKVERAVTCGGGVLGKIAGLEGTGTTLKVQAIDDLKAHHRLPLLLHLAKIPRSTFHDHRNRLTRPDRHEKLKEAIRQIFTQARSAYGHRRVLAMLLQQGWTVSKKTVLKLMRGLGLKARCVAGADTTPSAARSVRRLITC